MKRPCEEIKFDFYNRYRKGACEENKKNYYKTRLYEEAKE